MRRMQRMQKTRMVQKTRMQNRTGGTLVVVCILLFALLGVSAIAIDFARMYTFRAQLQTTADASAQAAAGQLLGNDPGSAPETALVYRNRNLVNNTPAVMTLDSVFGGTWDDETRTFTEITNGSTEAGWDHQDLNAVKVFARYTGNTTLGRLFRNTLTTRVQAIGAIAYTSGSGCLKPWAVSYQSMLNSLYKMYPGVPVPDATTYELTEADIDSLRINRTKVTFALDNNTTISGGNVQQVKLQDPWNGNADYKAAIVNDCFVTRQINPGDTLEALPGAGGGQTDNSVKELCEVQGNAKQYNCNPPDGVPIKMAIWDKCVTKDGSACANGANMGYVVKYIGWFVLTRYSREENGKNPNPSQVEGYFTAMASDGGVTFKPTPMPGKALLVQ